MPEELEGREYWEARENTDSLFKWGVGCLVAGGSTVISMLIGYLWAKSFRADIRGHMNPFEVMMGTPQAKVGMGFIEIVDTAIPIMAFAGIGGMMLVIAGIVMLAMRSQAKV